jgi:hypothetical protein
MTSLTFRPRVPVFDANVRVGHRHDEPSPAPERAALLAELDRHGVGRALVYHAQGEEVSALDGNRFLEAWLADDGRLIAQWSVIPTPESLAQIQALHAQGRVSAVRLFETWPDGAPLRPWIFGDLLNWLEAQRVPVWIPLPKIDPDDLVRTLQEFPDLVTVLVGAHYVHHLLVRPLLKTLPTAHLELSRYEPIGGVEALCREFGAERLVYGSWYWRYAMGPMLYYLHQTDLSEAELAMVCAGNLERILKGDSA